MITDLIYNKDKYNEFFTSVINLLENDSLTYTELREFIEIMESTHTFAISAIRKAIQKSDMPLDRKVQFERELEQ